IGRLVDTLHLVNDPEWGRAPAHTPSSATQREIVIAAVSRAVDIRRRGTTYAVEVNVSAAHPAQAAQMANQLVQLFQQYELATQMQSVDRANAWLGSRLNQLRADVQQKEAAAERYRAQNGLISTQGSLLTEQQT